MEGLIQGLICIQETILCVFRAIMLWLESLVLWFPRIAYADIMSWFSAFISGLDFITRIQQIYTLISSLVPQIGFFLDLAKSDVGIGIVISAYLLRFFIRRLPVIG